MVLICLSSELTPKEMGSFGLIKITLVDTSKIYVVLWVKWELKEKEMPNNVRNITFKFKIEQNKILCTVNDSVILENQNLTWNLM